ncbi:DUF4276 family protein [Vibrio sp. 10N.286.49.B1]|uniref:DUF4276 family protein n=1 Tax=unclassified Vibrio TaxID=2614977 RepID=UPI0018E4D6C4|nr:MULTISPECIES: DUF4276 family protein [unclassified Vibrio]
MEEKSIGREATALIRVKIFVEGQTEETFVYEVLTPYFSQRNIFFTPILAQTSKGYKGGIVSYGKVKHQVERLCKEDKDAYVTTLIDFYGLPTDFPNFKSQEYQGKNDAFDKVKYLEQAFENDINQQNFIGNLLLHEYEALLFCDPSQFEYWLDSTDPIERLLEVKASFISPEHINNSPQTAPSKRILSIMPNYKKTLHGPLIACDIGLNEMRSQCKHFNDWLVRIENLNAG